MEFWPFWLGGLALAAIALGHWLTLHRQMAVSGRFTALVNRWRFGPTEQDTTTVSNAELVAAMRELTAAEFGAEALATNEAPDAGIEDSSPVLRKRQPPAVHSLFLASLFLGGLLSAWLAGNLRFSMTLDSRLFSSIFGEGWPGALALLVGGLLVGFGTRMAAGCTSGHGLCGVSRFQKGSLLATACFFGAGILVSFALGALI